MHMNKYTQKESEGQTAIEYIIIFTVIVAVILSAQIKLRAGKEEKTATGLIPAAREIFNAHFNTMTEQILK